MAIVRRAVLTNASRVNNEGNDDDDDDDDVQGSEFEGH